MKRIKNLMTKVQVFISTLLTWVTYISFVPTVFYALYCLFVDFDFQRVIACVIVLWACIHLNKSL